MPPGANPNAWHNWYHAVGSTHGTWIRGDPRGFRTYRHTQHVDGDYRNPPPPGVYAPLFEYGQGQLKHPPVKLAPEQRRIVCASMITRLKRDKADVIALAIGINHFHLLARFALLNAEEQARLRRSLLRDGRDPAPRHSLGLARKEASFALSRARLKPPGEVWARRPKFDPIRDRGHQVNVALYIWRHVYQGCIVYHHQHGIICPGTVFSGLDFRG